MKDAFLIELVKTDMERKGVASYFIEDKAEATPKRIEVGANQVLYLYYFFAKTHTFHVNVESANSYMFYNQHNTRCVNGRMHDSRLVTRHLSDVYFSPAGCEFDYLANYLLVRTGGVEP